MRISDWSSDVCSSDLQPVAPFTFVAAHQTVVGRLVIERRDGAGKRRLGPRAIRAMAGAQLQPQGAPRATRAAVAQGVRNVAGAAHAQQSACGGFTAQRAVRSQRSEEHTSELQSLMRISYAVFCLKKKKQNR